MQSYLLFYDTETTGLPGKDYKNPGNTRVCQLSAILTDPTGVELEVLDSIIKPEKWTIPEQVAKIHGISHERAVAEGRSIEDVLDEFSALILKTQSMIAHNNQFDLKMLDIEFFAYGVGLRHRASTIKHVCTMELTKPICKLPGTQKMKYAGYGGYKPPKLIEAYTHVFGKGFEGAHNSLNDVRAMKEMYIHLLNKGDIKLPS